MKLFIHFLCFYLLVLMALPSVRAMKLQFAEKCEMNKCENYLGCKKDSESGCERGKFVMSLNFSPVQFINEFNIAELLYSFDLISEKKETSSYEKIFISKYQHSIWHPPKVFS